MALVDTSPPELAELRAELERIEKTAPEDEWDRLSVHAALVAEVKLDDIGVSSSNDPLTVRNETDSNCFARAVGFESIPVYQSLQRAYPLRRHLCPFLNQMRFERLLHGRTDHDRALLEPLPINSPSLSAIVVYMDECSRPLHAGIRDNEWVVSKWGTRSRFRHDPWAVPSSYGSKLGLYEPADRAALFKAYLNGLHQEDTLDPQIRAYVARVLAI